MMFLPFILLLCASVCFAQTFYRNRLRGMHQEEIDRIVAESLSNTVDSITNRVIYSAKQGKTKYAFFIMCNEYPNKIQCGLEQPNMHWQQLSKYGVNYEEYVSTVIFMLQATFVDSNITQIDKNCCKSNIISWK